MADGQGVTLMVTLTDPATRRTTEMSLSDYLKQADDAMAQADAIPGDAIVKLSNGQTMTGSQYQQMVAGYQQQAHDNANRQFKAFTASMNLRVETFSGLAAHMHDNASSLMSILADLRAALHGISAAFGDDDIGQKAQNDFAASRRVVEQNLSTLAGSVTNIGDGLSTSASQTFACERDTLAGFGRKAVDPRDQFGPRPRLHGPF